MRVKLRELAAVADPKKAILDAIGDISWFEVFHNQVLVATFVPPEKIGNIYVPDRALEENRFQGKTGLVLAVGPMAFQDDAVTKFGGLKAVPGDWVMFRPGDGLEMFIRDRRGVNDGISCRLFDDTFIKGRVDDPAMIY